MGLYIARHDLTPDVALVSPAQRTRQTWKRIANALSRPPSPIYEQRLSTASSKAMCSRKQQLWSRGARGR